MGVVQGVEGSRPAHGGARTAIEPEALAWLLAVPVALLAIVLIAGLGPSLGKLLHAGENPYDVWRELRWAVVAEPTERGRFLLALLAPLLLAGALAATARRGLTRPRSRSRSRSSPRSRGSSCASSCSSGSSTKCRYTRRASRTAGATSRRRR